MTKGEWTKIRKARPGIWQHVSGWRIYHCGHPTALWPYYALPPGVSAQGASRDQMLLHDGMGLGHAFQKLVHCQDAVEAKVRRQD